VLANLGDVERSLGAQRPGERSPPLGLREAVGIGMQPGAPTTDPPAQIENQFSIDDGDTQQLTGQRPDPATDAGPYGPAPRKTCGYRFLTMNH
jgi:hypothetical protein